MMGKTRHLSNTCEAVEPEKLQARELTQTGQVSHSPHLEHFQESELRASGCDVLAAPIRTLKTELIHRHTWATRAQARQAIFEFIEGSRRVVAGRWPITCGPSWSVRR